MKDILDSIRLQINERLSSPLFGSFVAAWLGWNHRFLFVLFSSLPVDKKFEFIDSRIYVTGWDVLNNGVIKPALTAIVFIYLYPVVSKHFFGYWLKKNRELKMLRDKIDNATLLTREESYAIRMEMIKTGEKYEELIRRQAADIEALKKQPANKAETEIYRNEANQLRIEVGKLREAASRTDKTQNDRNKIAIEIKSLVAQGEKFLRAAQDSEFSIGGQPLAEITTWVGRIGKILRTIYGENSQEFNDFTNLTADDAFYDIHSNHYTQIARMLGITKNIMNDLDSSV